MASGAGITSDRLLDLADSLNRVVRRFRIVGSKNQLLISLDSKTRSLLSQFAEHNGMTPEESAVCWLELQANAYKRTAFLS